MADATPARDASAPQILAALRKLDAEITAARAEIGNLERQVAGTLGAGGGAGGAVAAPRGEGEIRRATAALEEENAVARQGVQTELQRLEAIKAQTAERRRASIQTPVGYAPSARVAGQSMEADRLAAQTQAQEAARVQALKSSIIVPDDRRFSSNVGQRLEDERSVQLEQQRNAELQQEATKQDAIAAIQARRNELQQQDVALGREADTLRARQVTVERDIAAEVAFANRELVRQNALMAEATRLPAGQRAAFLRQGLATPQPFGAPGTNAAAQGATRLVPYTERDLAGMTAGSQGLDAESRLASTRQRVTELSRAENEYAAATQSSSALSSQFISRLASGDASLREFASNLGETASKFGGWLAAGAGVYALIGFVSELGKGAKDSASGVNQLARSIDNVNPGQAQTGFRQVSSDLNVGIKEVADAQFMMSRTFNNQTDSLTAAKVVLEAYKLDNVNTADAVRTLTAVHNQFGVSAAQMPGIFDQLDQGQRKYNARVGETMAALTRSSAAVKNAGGDLQGLIPIVEYGVRVTGQSGNVVGNALARSAANFVPKNAQEIRALGLDPTQGYTELITQAIQKASSMSGAQRQALARALGGPQLGSRVFAPLLGDSAMFNDVLQNTTPEKSKGAAQEELNNKLKQTDEQLHAVINNLQRLGSALAESGAFGGLGGALQVVNFMLSSLTKVVQVFDQLPASVRPWIAGLLEARAIMLLLQRTNFGAGIADATGLGFLGPNATERGRRAQVGGLTTEATAYEGSAASSMARSRATAAEAGVQQQIAAQARLDAEQAATQEDRDALIQKANAAEAEGSRLLAQSAAQEEIAAKLRQDALDARTKILALQKRELEVDAELVAEQQAQAGNRGGWWGAGGGRSWTGRKTATDPAAASEDAAAAEMSGAAATDAAASKKFTEAQARKVAAEEELATADAEAATAATRGAAAADEAALAEDSAAVRIGQAATQTAAAGARFTRGIFGWMDGLGLFSKALGAFIIGQMFFDRVKQESAAMARANENLTRGVGSLGDLQAQHKAAVNQSQAREPLAASAFDALIHPEILGFQPFGERNAVSQRRAGAEQAKLLEQIQRERTQTQASPLQQVGYSYQELLNEQQADIDAFRTGHITRAEFNRRYAELGRSMQVSLEAETGDAKGLKDAQSQAQQAYAKAMEQAGPTAQDPFAQFRSSNIDQNLKFMQGLQDSAKLTGGRGSDFDTLVRGVTYITANSDLSDPDTAKKVLQAHQALDTFFSDQETKFKHTIQVLSYTGSNIAAGQITPALALQQLGAQSGAESQAYDSQIATLQRQRAALTSHMGQVGKSVTDDQATIRRLQTERAQADPLAGTTFGPITIPGRSTKDIDIQIQHLRDRITQERKQLKDTNDSLAQDQQKIDDLIAQRQEANYQQASQAIDLRSQYAQATATDKSDAIAAKIQADGQQVQLALRYHGPDRWAKIIQALITQQQDIASQAQQHLQDIQLQGDVRTSAIQTIGPAGDMARLQSQLSTARQVLAAAQSEPNTPNKHDDILNAMRAVNDLNFQIAQTVQTQAQEADKNAQALYDSQMAVKIAQAADDPVKKDRFTLEMDLHDLRALKPSDFKTTGEYQAARNQALAKVISDRKQITTDTAQTDIDNAKFEHDIGQLTDQQYIDQLRKILQMKGITRSMRQNLLREIYQMQHQDSGALELNAPGGITAPSMYEVVKSMRVNAGRRVGGAISASSPMVHQTNNNNFNFNFNGGDPQRVAAAVAGALEKATGGSALANLRAAGAI